MPYSPTVFVTCVLAYQLIVGAGYAAYVAIVLTAIGRRSAATNFSFMGGLSNIPIAPMATFDGWVHDAYATRAMLIGELALPVVTIAAFAVFLAALGRVHAGCSLWLSLKQVALRSARLKDFNAISA